MENENNKIVGLQKSVETVFENTLWYSRLVLVFGVISCVITGIGLIVLGISEVFRLLEYLFSYIVETNTLITRDQIILYVIKILDTFLLSSILFIFSFGLYELFISPIQKHEDKQFASKAFEITTIDQLKAKLGKVVIMLLVIKVFAYLVEIRPVNIIETLYLALIVLCVAVSLWIGQKKN